MDLERFIEEAQREAAGRETPPSAHPPEDHLWAYVTGGLSERASWRVAAHLGSCQECSRRLDELRETLRGLEARFERHLPSLPLPGPRSWWRFLRESFDEWLRPRRWARHAAAYAFGSLALLGLNAALNYYFPPPGWWAPYAIGAWGGLLGLHGLLALWRFYRSRRNGE